MPKTLPFLPQPGQSPNWPCISARPMPQAAVAGTNSKLNRKGTGRTGRQISYKIARARYNESATAAMKRVFATARQLSPAATPNQQGSGGRCASALAATNPKLNRKGTGRTGRQISYKNVRARYDESATAAMKRNLPRAMPQSGSAVINPKLNRKDFRSFRSKISYNIHRASYDMTAKKCQKLDLVTARQFRRSHPPSCSNRYRLGYTPSPIMRHTP